MSATQKRNWTGLADEVISGKPIDKATAVEILLTPDEQILELMDAAFRIRRHYFGKTVQLYFLMNAKSGLCPEDCNYCSQSKISKAPVEKYNLLDREKLLPGARVAHERDCKTY